MKALPIILIVAILGVMAWYFIAGYSSSKPATPPSPEKIKVTDTLVLVKDSIINAGAYDSIPSGIYQGSLPCKNCEAIQRTILFAADGRYKMEELNWGKGTIPRRTEGNWEKDKDAFVLYANEKPIAKYRMDKDSLINTMNEGTPIPDSMQRQWVLFKKNIGPENPNWKKRRSEGVEIIGTGNDPFWNVEIDKEKYILFKYTGAARPVIVPIEKPMVAKDSTTWSIPTDAGNILKISVAPRFCGDGVSDHVYEYRMTVWYKGQTYKGCGVILN